MDLTDSFMWEDLPTRDADTGHLTAAGWIPLTMKYSVRVAIAGFCFHIVQSTIRMVKNHETLFVAWYPFEWNVSPFYELINISQVTMSKSEFSYITSYGILNLTLCVNLYFLCILFSYSFPIFFYTLFSKDVITDRWTVGWQIKSGNNFK
jgi:hypothetical protein